MNSLPRGFLLDKLHSSARSASLFRTIGNNFFRRGGCGMVQASNIANKIDHLLMMNRFREACFCPEALDSLT